jgi:small subunit ribosomal protein S1
MTDETITSSEPASAAPTEEQHLVALSPAGEPVPEPQFSVGPNAEADAKSPGSPVGDQNVDQGLEGQSLADEPTESFADLLTAFERSHTHRAATKQLEGTVISLSADQVFLDIGYKTEGVLPRTAFENNAEAVKPGDAIPVSVTGRNEEGYYQLTRFRVAQPRDWSALEAAFAEKTAVVGTVTAVIKGGLSVDVGVRAFMPASRSGTRDAAELEALVGQQINCRITKLDVTDEDVVVDRRVVLEEQARGELENRRASLKPGDTVTGTVRTLMPYGAFVDIGGVDGLLHVSDISRARVTKPEDVISVGQQLTLRILKIDPESKKISLGLKQLEADPWTTAPERYVAGQRVTGSVTRLMDFGAFVEIEPGLEGLIHISEMSWAKKVRHPSDLLKQGDRVDAVILSVKPEEKRIALGLKQALADPWLEVEKKFPVGSQVEGPVSKIMNFGAFVQIAEGIDGLVHISEIVADRRINHPRDVLREGQRVQALVLGIDSEKRQIKLSMKQLIPTSIDEYIAEHKPGDIVSGRVVELAPDAATVELGAGIRGTCSAASAQKPLAPVSQSKAASGPAAAAPDLSQLSSMLKARWKGNAPAPAAQPDPLAAGQVRTFRIVKLDAGSKKIEVELA